jgi:transcription elongation factor Elf1
MNDDADEIDTWFTDEPVCPHCGHAHDGGSEYHESNDTVRIQCSECEMEFESERSFAVSYSTSKIDHAAEAAAAEQKRVATAARLKACQEFPPGCRVRVRVGLQLRGVHVGMEGVVANCELSKTHPCVVVQFEDLGRVFLAPVQLELLQ